METAPFWWRPSAGEREGEIALEAPQVLPSSPAAFVALVAFTIILLLSPQIWMPILGTLRIALLTAGAAIGVHLLRRVTRQDGEERVAPEIVLALGLVSWAVMTIPVSYWPAGSMQTLTEHYL